MIDQRWLVVCWILLVSMIFLALCIQFFPYTLDDSYITFRYASNFAAGNGLVFNPGEMPRAEGITSPFYGVLLAFPILLGGDVVFVAKLAGVIAIACSGFLVARLTLIISSSIGGECALFSGSGYSALMGSSFFLCSPFVVANAVSGMETAFATLTLLVFTSSICSLLIRPSANREFGVILVGIAALLVPMFRPELALFVVITFFVLIGVLPDYRKVLFRSFAVFLGLGLSYFLLRFYYYGLPLPLPFYIKQGSASDYLGLPDVTAFLEYLSGCFLLFVLAGLAAWLCRRVAPVGASLLLSLFVASILQLCYYTTLQHIMGFGFRYFIPVMAEVIIVASVTLALCFEGELFDKLVISRFAKIVAVALMLSCFVSNFRSVDSADELLLSWYGQTMDSLARVATQMRPKSDEPIFTLALNDCGVIPFTTNLPVLDLGGLNNRNIALAGMTIEGARAELLRASPDVVLLTSTAEHGFDQLYGWENIDHATLDDLGYAYRGSIQVSENYFYVVYENGGTQIDSYILRLIADGVIVEPPYSER